MFLKRFIVLAAGVLLFIAAFLIYFNVSHAQMERRFQEEREKFQVEGLVLTAAQPAGASATAPAPVAGTNTLIGPVSPSSTPSDSTEAPASPAAPEPIRLRIPTPHRPLPPLQDQCRPGYEFRSSDASLVDHE